MTTLTQKFICPIDSRIVVDVPSDVKIISHCTSGLPNSKCPMIQYGCIGCRTDKEELLPIMYSDKWDKDKLLSHWDAVKRAFLKAAPEIENLAVEIAKAQRDLERTAHEVGWKGIHSHIITVTGRRVVFTKK